MSSAYVRAVVAALATGLIAVASADAAHAQGSVLHATLAEPNQKTPEVSTDEVRRILADGSAILIDSRKRAEYVAGHIAGAKSPMLEGNAPPEAAVAAVGRIAGGDKAKPLVLYCNGPHCQASRQLGEQLVAAGLPCLETLDAQDAAVWNCHDLDRYSDYGMGRCRDQVPEIPGNRNRRHRCSYADDRLDEAPGSAIRRILIRTMSVTAAPHQRALT